METKIKFSMTEVIAAAQFLSTHNIRLKDSAEKYFARIHAAIGTAVSDRLEYYKSAGFALNIKYSDYNDGSVAYVAITVKPTFEQSILMTARLASE